MKEGHLLKIFAENGEKIEVWSHYLIKDKCIRKLMGGSNQLWKKEMWSGRGNRLFRLRRS